MVPGRTEASRLLGGISVDVERRPEKLCVQNRVSSLEWLVVRVHGDGKEAERSFYTQGYVEGVVVGGNE